MQTLTFEQLPQGGFAGLIERRFVTDSQVFGSRRAPGAQDGLGRFVYLADANFLPGGDTGMHPHREVDVISVMVSGRVSHEGSLEHGQSLEAGSVQVQRAGGEGFSHNEINPDATPNHMIQLWMLPDQAGEPAGYKLYQPEPGKVTRVYGGPQGSQDTFYSSTLMDVALPVAGQTIEHQGEVMAYLSQGSGEANGQTIGPRTLVRAQGLKFTAAEDAQLILVHQAS